MPAFDEAFSNILGSISSAQARRKALQLDVQRQQAMQQLQLFNAGMAVQDQKLNMDRTLYDIHQNKMARKDAIDQYNQAREDAEKHQREAMTRIDKWLGDGDVKKQAANDAAAAAGLPPAFDVNAFASAVGPRREEGPINFTQRSPLDIVAGQGQQPYSLNDVLSGRAAQLNAVAARTPGLIADRTANAGAQQALLQLLTSPEMTQFGAQYPGFQQALPGVLGAAGITDQASLGAASTDVLRQLPNDIINRELEAYNAARRQRMPFGRTR